MMQESVMMWGGALGLCASILFPYFYAIRRRDRLDRERLAEAQRLGIDRPKGLFPYVDPEICIGCGGCIKACPEGDVLGLVGGLAVVVNGARCIGIGQCEKVCPVGAIEVGLGDVKGRTDLPTMNEHRETNVPGIYIAGELGGLALVRNAVEQGRETVRQIAQELNGDATGTSGNGKAPIDLAIVGAGPAGLSAALAATEQGLSYQVFERETSFGGTIYHYPRRKLTHTQPVDLPLHGALTRGEYSKEELLEIFEGLIERHDLQLRFGEPVLGVERENGHLNLRTPADTYRFRRVLLALGRRGTPRKLGVPGEELPKVMYQVRDAQQYQKAHILCVGGGDSAVEAAMGLARQPGNRVTISYRKEKFFRIKKKNEVRLEKMIAKGKVQPLFSSQVLEIGEGFARLGTESGETVLDNDFVFVLIGGVPPFGFLREMGIGFGGEVR